MSLFGVPRWPPLVTITPLSMAASDANVRDMLINIDAIGSGGSAWPSANRALFFPFRLEEPVIVAKLWWGNSTPVGGNIDCGIYDGAGTRLVSTGSTAQSGTSALQEVDITDTTLGPGTFYLALAADSTTPQILGYATGSTLVRLMSGIAMMDSAFPLPATATYASATAYGPPLVGLTTRSVL